MLTTIEAVVEALQQPGAQLVDSANDPAYVRLADGATIPIPGRLGWSIGGTLACQGMTHAIQRGDPVVFELKVKEGATCPGKSQRQQTIKRSLDQMTF